MSEDVYHLDFETYSPEDLQGVGAFKYCASPAMEILVMGIAKNDDPVEMWSVLDQNPDALMLLFEAIESGAEIWAHNKQFEYAAFLAAGERTFGKGMVPTIEQMRCTAELCRLAAIPSSLEDAGSFLALDVQKDSEGGKLIDKFSSPRKPTRHDKRTRIRPEDDPEDFQRFVDYCRCDVETERALHKVIAPMQQPSPGQAISALDLRMNVRGIPVNLVALRNAAKMIEEYSAQLVPRFQSETATLGESVTLPVTKQRKTPKVVPIDEGFNPTQREMMLGWLATRGFTGDNLQSETVDKWLVPPLVDRLTPEARKAMHTYSLVTSAAVKKIPAMLERADADGYVRGALLLFGAERSHRWTGKGIQPQNFARPSIVFTELAYAAICKGWSWQEIEMIFGDLYDVLASCIRHFIQPHDGAMVLQADYTAIEACTAPWLSEEEATLELFRRGEPVYEIMAALIFGKRHHKDVTAGERFIGKQAVLGCSYNMGRPKFRATCEKYGFRPTPEMVEAYKPKHGRFVFKAIAKVEQEIQRKFDKKGMPVPQKYLDREFVVRKACTDNGWTTIDPKTDDQWNGFAYDELADRAVSTWRANNPKIVAMWRELDTVAKDALQNPGKRTKAGKLEFMSLSASLLGFPALGMRLPSGHYLIYPKASIVPNETRGWGTQIRFWGVIPNSNGQWGWCYTYGGKLLENATQATAGDVMREGALVAEAAGYAPFMLVHDEFLAIQSGPHQTHEHLCKLLCTMPPWADGLPLKAEGSTIPFYKK